MVILETHGRQRDFESLQHRLKSFYIYWNPGVDPSTGGVLVCIRKDTLYDTAVVHNFSSVIPGRLSRLEFQFSVRLPQSEDSEFSSLVLWAMHDFGIPNLQAASARTLVNQDISSSLEHPLGYMVVFIGDINRMKQGEKRCYLDPN